MDDGKEENDEEEVRVVWQRGQDMEEWVVGAHSHAPNGFGDGDHHEVPPLPPPMLARVHGCMGAWVHAHSCK